MPDETTTQKGSTTAFLIRFFWMFLGNVCLFFIIIGIWEKHIASFTMLDVYYGAIVFTSLIIRYIDIVHFNGTTADGEPATLKEWKQYSISFLLIASAILCVTHGIIYVF